MALPAGYGDLANVPAQIGEGMGKMFEAFQPNPQSVADAIVGLINAPILECRVY